MRAQHLAAALGACLLAACAGSQQASTPPEPARSDASTSQAASPKSKPSPPAGRDLSSYTPDKLIGLSSDAVDRLLGAPDIVRHDGPAEVRLYRDLRAQCTFHVFLYANNGAAQSSAVEYYEARNGTGRLSGADITACYHTLIEPAATS